MVTEGVDMDERSTRRAVLLARPLLAVIVLELLAAGVPRIPSPVFGLAALLVERTPGPFATWFLTTFRSLARPLTIAFAAVCVLAVAAGVQQLLRRPASSEGTGAAGPTIGRRALVGGLLLTTAAVVSSRRTGSGAGAGGGAGAASEASVPLGPALRAPSPLTAVTAAQDLAPAVPGLAPILTPNDAFYRIDTSLRLPRIELETWRLRIHGLVEEEIDLDFDGLVALGLVEHDVTLSCVSNEIGGGLVGTARWTGVPLTTVLALARPLPSATQLVGRSEDGWTAGFPTGLAATPGALVAIGMNGDALPQQHGWPARLVVPGLYGYVSATKWLTELELTTWEGFDAFWIERRWGKEGPIKLAARVDVPDFGTIVPVGPLRTAGVAWGPDRGISRVEVRLDDGPWQDATLSDPLGTSTWVQWVTELDLPEGRHVIEVRCYDGDGQRQLPGPRPVMPDGAEGWHRRSVRAEA
jgi:DMSO/TMAO reductase YedYZ molybdopterin-dependent catalytic subunit